MTDPDAPSGEYLHWLITYFIPRDDEEVLEKLEEEIISYKAPREGARRIVVTLLEIDSSIKCLPSVIVSKSTYGFSTINFADTNRLGLPLAATLFKINDQYEEAEKSEENGVSTQKRKFKKLADEDYYYY